MRTKSKWINRVLTFYNGPINDETVNKSTAASTAVANYGVTQLKNATSEGVWVLEAPVLGVKKTILVSNTTKIFHIKTNAATINNSTDDVLTVTPSTVMKELGVGFNFYGASTALWYLVNDIADINSSQVTITLTSTT
jgi:hypothetical protein